MPLVAPIQMLMLSDRIQDLKECNRGHFQQISSLQNSIEIILQRLRRCEQTSRQVEPFQLCSRVGTLQAIVEHQAATTNVRLTQRVEVLEQMLQVQGPK